jgi:ribosomal protein S18 acetylase RimI-like enzyme
VITKAIVRRSTESDADSLLPLVEAYVVDFYGRPHPGKDKLHDLITKLVRGEGGVQFVADSNGRLVGFATLYFTHSTLEAEPVAIMNDLYLAEDARGSTAARDLYLACRAESKAHGCAYMTWETASDNHRAQAFYAKMGGVREDWLTYSDDLS